MKDILINNLHNRVAGGFSPPAPTAPRMRLRTGRFINLHHVRDITPGVGLLWPLLTSVFSPFKLLSLAQYTLISCLPSLFCISRQGGTFPVCAGMFVYRNPTGDFTWNDLLLHGIRISQDKNVNFWYAGKRGTRLRAHHLPYLLFLGRNHVVLTYPETRPIIIFLFVAPYLRSLVPRLPALRLPSDPTSR